MTMMPFLQPSINSLPLLFLRFLHVINCYTTHSEHGVRRGVDQKKKSFILGWDKKGVSFESPRIQWASNYNHTIQFIILEGVIWVRAHWHVNLIILFFLFLSHSLFDILSLFAVLSTCIVHRLWTNSISVSSYLFTTLNQLFFSSPQKPWSFLNLNPSFQRF